MTERPSAGVRRVLSLLVGIGLLTAVVWRLGLTTFLQALGELPLGVLPLAVAIGAVPPVCYAWRWRRILELADQPISLVEALRVTVAATTANYLVPAFGWAPAKIALTRRWLRMGVTQTVPSVVLEQLIDLTVLAVLGGRRVGPHRQAAHPAAIGNVRRLRGSRGRRRSPSRGTRLGRSQRSSDGNATNAFGELAVRRHHAR
jgi:hypothetical protein